MYAGVVLHKQVLKLPLLLRPVHQGGPPAKFAAEAHQTGIFFVRLCHCQPKSAYLVKFLLVGMAICPGRTGVHMSSRGVSTTVMLVALKRAVSQLRRLPLSKRLV